MESISDYIGPFEIRGKLGRGAMATVWRGYDPSLDREVAIKEPTLPPDSSDSVREEFSQRFVREARAAARLNHPGIVTIYSAAVFDERPVIVMELIEGCTLRQILKNGPLTARQTFALMDQLLQAVGYAHEHGVTHRDLKPDNIFVTPSGNVKLADFGIAQLGPKGTVSIYDTALAHADSGALTRVGTMLGTPAYMAPEQIRAELVDARCDVFALGVIAYECMSGTNPFGSETNTHFATILHRIMSEPAPPLEVDDAVAGPLSGVIMKALKKERENRFENAVAMLSAWRSSFAEQIDGSAELASMMQATDSVAESPTEAFVEAAPKTRHWARELEPVGAVPEATFTDVEAADGDDTADAETLSSEQPTLLVMPDADVPPAEEAVVEAEQSRETRSASSGRWRKPLLIGVLGVVALVVAAPLLANALNGKDEPTVAPAPKVAEAEPTETVPPAVTEPPAPASVRLGATSSRYSVKKGQSFILRATIASTQTVPNGSRVILQRRYPGGGWQSLGTLLIRDRRASISKTTRKTVYFRFVFMGTDTLKSGISRVLTIKFKKPVVVYSAPSGGGSSGSDPEPPSYEPPPPPPPN